MKKLDKLMSFAEMAGLEIEALEYTSSGTEIFIRYFDKTRANKFYGLKPVDGQSRDEKDHLLKVAQWHKAGIIYSPEYESFDEMLTGEIKRLKNDISNKT